MKILFIIISILIVSISFGQTEVKSDVIEVEKTDKICESGLDIDSCAYIPLYKALYKWLGTPYKYAGTTKKGIDCSGFTKAVLRDSYSLQLSGGSRDIYTRCTPVDAKNLREGDLVFFKINKSNISHVGIYLQDGYFAHASVTRGVMINHLSEDYYKKYFYSGGRLSFS